MTAVSLLFWVRCFCSMRPCSPMYRSVFLSVYALRGIVCFLVRQLVRSFRILCFDSPPLVGRALLYLLKKNKKLLPRYISNLLIIAIKKRNLFVIQGHSFILVTFFHLF